MVSLKSALPLSISVAQDTFKYHPMQPSARAQFIFSSGIDCGITMDLNDEQTWSDFASIRFWFHQDSNVNDKGDAQDDKVLPKEIQLRQEDK
jgi:hypothetical protein